MSNGIAVRLEGVEKTYQKGGRDISVLRDLDVEIAAGEAVAIVGPSGCGSIMLL